MGSKTTEGRLATGSIASKSATALAKSSSGTTARVRTIFFTYNIRFAGQVFDGEAGLHQNHMRDYDPAVGRYVESDPIGLIGGINTHAYVGDGPLMDIRAISIAILIALTSLATTAAADPCQSKEYSVDIHKAISIADDTMAHETDRTSSLEVNFAKRYSTPWNELVPKGTTDKYLQQLAAKLKDRRYWLVYYRSQATELGGDIAVFVDASSGEVIGVYGGR